MQFITKTHIGRETETDYRVNLYDDSLEQVISFFRSFSPLKIYKLGTADNLNNPIQAFDISMIGLGGIKISLNYEETEMANVELYNADETTKRDIYDLTGQILETEKIFYLTNKKSFPSFPINGLGSLLSEISWVILSRLEGIHVADFTRQGFQKSSRRFIEKGYDELRKLSQQELLDNLGYKRAVELQFSNEQGIYCFMYKDCSEL